MPVPSQESGGHVFICYGVAFASFYDFDIWLWKFPNSGILFFILQALFHTQYFDRQKKGDFKRML